MDCAAIIQRQRTFFETGATRPVEFRRQQLSLLADGLECHESAVLAALQADLRKSPYQAYATEIGLVQGEIRHALRHLRCWARPRRRRVPRMAWPARGFTLAEPYGVVCILGPWNYPFQLLLAPLVGAIAAGNCVLIKPSEFAPQTAAAIGDIIHKNFPSEYISVVQGGREVAEALLAERFDSIFFTGSTAVGRAVMAAAARYLTPVTLELGGKCPCLVCADAPLEITARRIVWGKFMNAGQTCVAPDFILADSRIAAPLLEQLKLAVVKFYGEDPHKSPEYGRIVNDRHFDRLTAYLANGRIAHGGKTDSADLYMAPTILTDVPPDAPVMRDEIFGPILPVLEFAALQDALALLRNGPTPLALYLFTRDRDVQDRVLRETRSGGVALNDTVLHIVGTDLPFGGLGESGLGAYHGRASFDAFSHNRSVLRRSFAFDSNWRYPPARLSLPALKRVWRFLLGN